MGALSLVGKKNVVFQEKFDLLMKGTWAEFKGNWRHNQRLFYREKITIQFLDPEYVNVCPSHSIGLLELNLKYVILGEQSSIVLRHKIIQKN